jgi:Fic family protein
MSIAPFVPPLLPLEIDYSSILSEVLETRDKVARFDEAVKRLPNPLIIQRSFETKEAVLSSKIEGTQATLEDVLLFDAQENQNEESEKERDYREIFNYRRAIGQGTQLLKERSLGENVIKELHKILLDSSRGRHKDPGQFRRQQVFIGPYGATIEQATFVPPGPQHINNLFSNFEKYLNEFKEPDPIVQIAIAHYQFEAIHPFLDGNGRVGRILIPLFLYEKGITAYPNIYVSEFLEKHRDTYYALLKGVSEKGDWLSWIRFFLDAVRVQTEITLQKVGQIEELYKTLKEKMTSINSIYANILLDSIFIQPQFTTKSIKVRTGISNSQTVYTLIDKFLEAKIITEVTPTRERNKIYAFRDLINIIR